ncbi:DUF368 domain-containing protein [Corynebacterium mendelii]|uniref:DUF368 domain-containing protein n=1 Tax=Corynebacterium mendelii TaxID=2765362 RepID=A0A939E183_9CORY|nr:DUF368 domain-containing protein [Corynebacterium mendelii]MBN9644591.1 DUF368 domain-containing protein [Corynebacterium mendelii]
MTPSPSTTHRSVPGAFGMALRGVAVALAELVPGISGGTIALVTGIYSRTLVQAHTATTAAGRAATGDLAGARRAVKSLDWWLLVPLALGMLVTVFAMAGPMSHFVHSQPVYSRALFFGMVAASAAVPLHMIGPDNISATRLWVAGALSAVVAFIATGTTAAEHTDPAWWMIAGAAAIAVCALVLPGVSGSFVLLALGLYGPVLDAVSGFDIPVMVVFIAGALVGLVTIVRVVTHLLHTRRLMVLAVMTGLMIGSLRALWPWQHQVLHGCGPGQTNPLAVTAMMALGALAVTAVARLSSASEAERL